MADWFMPPVNHLHDLKKRMALPGAIPSSYSRISPKMRQGLGTQKLWSLRACGTRRVHLQLKTH
jgi:hypothetical protein